MSEALGWAPDHLAKILAGDDPADRTPAGLKLGHFAAMRWHHDDRDRTPAAAAALAALVRYLNHATLPARPGRTLAHAGDLDQLLGGFAVMAARLPQLLSQLHALALEFADDPSLYDDRRDRPGSQTAIELSVVLADTQSAAWTLASLLEEAGNCSAHLGHDIGTGTDSQ